MASGSGFGGGGGFHPIRSALDLGQKLIGSIFGIIAGIVIVGVIIGMLAFMLPMYIQGQKQGVVTGTQFTGNANVAFGAVRESWKTSKTFRDYGSQLQQDAAAKQLAKIKKTNA